MTVQDLRRQNRIKRFADLVFVLLTAPVTVPLSLMTGIAVRWRIGRPVLFIQERAGLNGRLFRLVKFRTMTDERDADGALLPDRARLTRLGRLLRMSSLDELPQLINIVRGDMALVGPRPLPPRYLAFYTEGEGRRHLVRPGVTGLAQVSGRNLLGWDARLAADQRYVETVSLATDCRIMWRTFRQVLGGRDVAVIAGDTGAPLDVERSYPRSERIRLRRLALSDLETRVEWMNDAGTRAYMRIDGEITVESTRAWFERASVEPRRTDFVAVDLAGTRVAMAGLRASAEGTAEFYVFVGPRQRGLGYGREVSQLVLRWGLDEAGFDVLTLEVHRDNAAARSIYLALGCRDEGFDGTRYKMSYRHDA